ncbi:ferredoxin--NAD(+) reductase [Methylobacterium sp. 2A]|jgi:NAD(P)H-flavin reductase|uniref:ferredoxin--NAD(+) reductase n=1 Tax=Methylobacterium sp. 2A TaxID=2603816 RepID=UPI001353A214|nr:ferredoxin--NAD(+) reductase [Methylobacterium sp. 2A]MWV21295.1 ferredoxin--NAD(+) reductase [Methylobacterium sp. 2A]
MGARCSLVVNGRSVRVSTGDTPLEAALAEGMIAPVQMPSGTPQAGAPLAGQGVAHQGAARPARRPPAHRARPEAFRPSLPSAPIPGQEEAPPIPVAVRKGTVTEIRRLSPGIVEIVATLTKRPTLEPGHQARVTFSGLPTLTLAPTLRVDGAAEINEAVFHIPRDPEGGPVDAIRLDQPVRLKGPVGRGQYRPGGGRLVLVAAGAGFGAIWAIARAARYVEPAREMALAIGARDALDLYMRESLDWLRRTGVARIVLCADRGGPRPPDVRSGPLTAHLPSLRATDVVHVAGDVSTVGAVQVLAASVGARCYPIVLA